MVYLLHFVPYPLFHVFIYEPLCLFLHNYLICYGVPPSLCSLPSVSCFHIWTSLSVPPHLSNLLWCTSFTLFLTLCLVCLHIWTSLSVPPHLSNLLWCTSFTLFLTLCLVCLHIWTSLSVPPHLSNLLWCTSFTLFLTLCFMFPYMNLFVCSSTSI